MLYTDVPSYMPTYIHADIYISIMRWIVDKMNDVTPSNGARE